MVAAPSMIPRRSGDRQKNDKRDAAALSVLHRGGLLTAVWVPDEAHEAMRDPRVKRPRTSLVRARQAAGAASPGPAATRWSPADPEHDPVPGLQRARDDRPDSYQPVGRDPGADSDQYPPPAS